MKKGIIHTINSILEGLSTTLKHFFAGKKYRNANGGVAKSNYFENHEGLVTIQYPKQKIPVPEVGRYQLHVEMDDCIVCDLCAKICPVDCIAIDSIKATEDIGITSDGTKKRLHATKFEIDMAKCMYCGLCTVVCPTECIIMTNEYDRSVPHVAQLNYVFAEMPPEEIEAKRIALLQFEEEKRKAKGL